MWNQSRERGDTATVEQNGLVGIFESLRDRFAHRGDSLVCRDVVELVTDYLEGAMSADERTRFERHLRACGDCTAYLEQVRRTVDTLGQVHPEEPDPATRQSLMDAFRDFHTPEP